MSTKDKPQATIHPDQQWAAIAIGNHKIVTEVTGGELRVTVYRVESDSSWTHISTEYYSINSTENPS